ncbi:MAG: DNA ligase [Deltaproteobacteria bacterium]|nr:DNA ligase [Deltaproteobacteria bacterium]
MPKTDQNHTIEKLVTELQRYNHAYRQGTPLISDSEYDNLVEELRGLDPENPFLHQVEPETFSGRQEVRHPQAMLSTEKAYTQAALARFIERAEKSAAENNLPAPRFRVTPKLDGLAARDDGQVFATRGNGASGYEISSAFAKGVVPLNGRGQGLGEIVISNTYFAEHLAAHFEHPRNLVVGIINSDTLNPYAEKALQAGAVQFVPYRQLPAWQGSGAQLLNNLATIKAEPAEQTDYPLDGLVAEVDSPELQKILGATDHHYRWQIAIKSKGETAVSRVIDITWQVGRTGSITPVLEIEPVNISGATIRRVTAHNAGLVREQKLGIGAAIEIIRSGEVIPKLEKVITPAAVVSLPEVCPGCSSHLEWSNDFLKCRNPHCPAQLEQQLRHWFKTLGTADWFGLKTVARLVENGYDNLEKIYAMREKDFTALAFGPQQSLNLTQALNLSRSKEVEDWRFLAAFGIPSLGRGDSRRLLARFSLKQLVNGIAPAELAAIPGFAQLTADNISQGLAQNRDLIRHLLDLGFNLTPTPRLTAESLSSHPLADKGIVFTGKMVKGSREAMEDEARQLGARVQTAVSRKTDYLVCGENVGATKSEKARQLGVAVISEAEYRKILQNHRMADTLNQ